MTVIAGAAPYGVAGVGQHLAQIVEEARAAGNLSRYYASAIQNNDSQGRAIEIPALKWLFRYTPLRFSEAGQIYVAGELFARAVAARLHQSDVFHTFSYHALQSLREARSLGCRELRLESASVHVNRVCRQQESARRTCGISEGWASAALQRRAVGEYELADSIYVSSQLAHDSFIQEGVPAERLRRRHLRVDPRFQPGPLRTDDGVFRIVAVGSLSVLKGTPTLLEAFARLKTQHAELIFVGGWGTRAMRRLVQSHLHRDSRIQHLPGDPLTCLQRANVCVHASFTDGFGYAPMEALACRVPVIVTDQTGMKEHVREGENGYVVPAGSVEALTARLEHLLRNPKALSGQRSCS